MAALTSQEMAIGRDRHNPMRLPRDQEEYLQRWLKVNHCPIPKQIIICPSRWEDSDGGGPTYTYLAGLYDGLDDTLEEWRPL